MGAACLSKPIVAIVRRRLGVLVHPQTGTSTAKEPVSNCFSRTAAPTSTVELSVVSPPTSFDEGNGAEVRRSKKSAARRTTTDGQGRPNGNSVKQRTKSPRGSRISLGFQGRAPSVASDTSSVMGMMNGFYALASMTAYEAKLVPDIWKSCLKDNKYYCEHVLSRLFNRHPELENMFDGAVLTCPMASKFPQPKIDVGKNANDDVRLIINKKSRHLKAFLHRLIIVHELDYDRLYDECDRLGRSHAAYFYERGLQPCHWDSLAYCIVQEYKKTQMNSDMATDEKELQQLSWTHFATAVVSTIKEAFENEIHTMPAPNAVDQMSVAGDVRF